MKKYLLFLISILFLNLVNGQHLKKDGTPDMRYKENKALYSPNYSSPNYGLHLKKDGTPDKRYKENRDNFSSTPKPSYSKPNSTSNRNSYQYNYVPRDDNGKIKRNSSAKYQFMKESGFPDGRTGYVIDHIKPLYKGGCDCPENMQWQTIEEAREKDKWE